jgi:serine/threonine protein kinase
MSHESANEEHLDEVLGKYLKALDSGNAPSRQELVSRHPELANSLQQYFANEDRLHHIVEPVGQEPATVTSVPAMEHVMEAPSSGYAAAQRQPIRPGQVLAGKYRIFDIKMGGMGTVYLADDLEARRRGVELKVALKTVVEYDEWKAWRESIGCESTECVYRESVNRFRREAAAWVRLGRHPNIVLAAIVIDIGEKPYLVMEYANSGDLRTWISHKRLSIPLAVNFTIQFCQGMQYAVNTAGMVHRDIKPANILIHNERLIKISDFGLAKCFFETVADATPAGRPSGPDVCLSSMGAGSRAYMAPEQFESLGKADTRSDIFSFGATLYEMLTSRPLFGMKTAYEMALFTEEVSPPQAANPEIPEQLGEIVLRCVAYVPEQRYQSFDALAADLSRVADELPDCVSPLPTDDQSDGFTPSVHALAESYSLMTLGNYARAATRAQDGIDGDPNNWENWTNRGKALAYLGDLNEALKCSHRATELNPMSAIPVAHLAWCKFELGDLHGAYDAAVKATKLDHSHSDGWLVRGRAEEKLGHVNEAIDSYKRSIDVEPHNWKAHASLGYCLLEHDRCSEAVDAFRKAVKLNPQDASLWKQLATANGKLGRLLDARAAIDYSIQLEQGDSDSWAVRGLILWQSKATASEVRHCLETSLKIDHGNPRTIALTRMMGLQNVEPSS